MLDVQGHHKQPKPSCSREAQLPQYIGSGALAFTSLSALRIASSCRTTELLLLHVSAQVGGSRNIFRVARDSFLDIHLTTMINSKALPTFRQKLQVLQ